MAIFWFVLNACFDFRVYYVVRWEISGCTMFLKVSAGLPFCYFRIYRNYCINVDVHLLRVFLFYCECIQ